MRGGRSGIGSPPFFIYKPTIFFRLQINWSYLVWLRFRNLNFMHCLIKVTANIFKKNECFIYVIIIVCWIEKEGKRQWPSICLASNKLLMFNVNAWERQTIRENGTQSYLPRWCRNRGSRAAGWEQHLIMTASRTVLTMQPLEVLFCYYTYIP